MKQTMLKRVTDYVRPALLPGVLVSVACWQRATAGGVSERLPEIVTPLRSRSSSLPCRALGHCAEPQCSHLCKALPGTCGC
jgi:hypothetical protein